MNYSEALDFLYQQLPMYQRVGAKAFKKDLDNIRALVTALGHPHSKFKSIHVAGTNGKGSVSNILASVLQEAGYKTGLYTSPHLRNFTERIRINGIEIPQDAVVNFVTAHQDIIQEIRPSFFELTVAMAFEHFAREKVDIAVIEVGLGGRLDSTNVISPELGIVTNISYDHTAFLGDTLAKIAREKAGIFKPGLPVVIGEALEETEPVFEEVAQTVDAKLNYVNKFLLWEDKGGGIDWKQGKITYQQGGELAFRLDLGGNYQLKNAATAILAIHLLREQGWNISKSQLLEGLGNVKSNTGFRGRMSVLSRSPLTIADVGHNEDGIRQLLKAWAEIEYEKLHLVWGSVNDKDISKILGMLPQGAQYYFVAPNVPRGLPASDLQAQAHEMGLSGEVYPNVAAGLEAAQKSAGAEDLVFVGGSTFVVAEII